MAVVSVGLPVRNGERYLPEALDSLLAQTVREVEIVVSDNASTDRTAEICRAYQARDPRIRYVRNDRDIGAAPNFNRVFALTEAPLFHAGACDDLYEPRFLERCIEVLGREPGSVLAHAATRLIGEEGEPLVFDAGLGCYLDSRGGTHGTCGDVMRPQPAGIAEAPDPATRFRDVLRRMGWSLPLSGVIRRGALARTPLYGTYSGADKVLLAELALQGPFREVPEKLFAKRIHGACTHFMSASERAAHEGADPRTLPQLRMVGDYLRMVLAAPLSPSRRLHCLLTIAGAACRGESWRRLLLPWRGSRPGLSPGRR